MVNKKSDALRFSECFNNTKFSHNGGVLPSRFFVPPISSFFGGEDTLLPVKINFIENYLWLLCRVAKQEHYGGDAGGSYE